MIKKVFLGLIITGILISGVVMAESDKTSNQDTIIIYKKGKEIKILPDSPYFQELNDEIENLVTNIDDMYRLIPDDSRFNKIKKKDYAVELIYVFPKEFTFLAKTIKVNKAFIPLSDRFFPLESIFIYYETQEDYPRLNPGPFYTKHPKDKLLKLIESLN